MGPIEARIEFKRFAAFFNDVIVWCEPEYPGGMVVQHDRNAPFLSAANMNETFIQTALAVQRLAIPVMRDP